jgi:hypothetical protein
MSLLKKLLGLGSPESKNKAPSKTFINRAHRVQVSLLHNVKFLPIDPPFAQAVSIANISTTGVGLFVKDFKNIPAQGFKLKGQIVVEGVDMPIQLEVKQKIKDVLGCHIVQPSNDLLGFIKNYFEVELEVFKLSAKPAVIQDDIEQNHLTGSEMVEVFWRNKLPQTGPLTEYRLSFFGNYIEGGSSSKPRFGSWVSGKQQNLNQVSELIWARVHWENHFPESEKEKALKLITYAPELTPEEKKFLKSELNKLRD